MLRHWKDPKILAGFAFFFFACLFLYWIAGDILQIAGDEGIYLEGGRRVALGQQPYRDFFVLTGPWTFWMEGLIARCCGMRLAIMRLPVILDAAFLAWAVYWLTSRYASTLYAAGTACAFLAYESRFRLLNVNHRWDSAALAVAAMTVAWTASGGQRRWLWTASGMLLACAALATPSMVVVALPLLVWSWHLGNRNLLAFVAGGAAAACAAAVFLQANGALIPMIQSMRWTAANYTAANRVPYGSVWLGAEAAGLHVEGWNYLLSTASALVPAILPPAVILGWAILLRRGRTPEAASIVAMLGVTAALALSAWPRWTADALLHTMAISWFLAALLLYRWTTPRQRGWFCGAVLLATAGSLAAKAKAPWDYWPRETRVGTLRDPGDEGEFLDTLQHRIQPGDTLFSFPYLASAYYFLNARNPTRYSFLQPGMMNREDERLAVTELEAAPPHWILYEEFPAETVLAIWPGSDPSLIPMEAVNRFISAHYLPVETVTGTWGRVVVMERLPGISP